MFFGGRVKIKKTTAWQDPQSADNVNDGNTAWSNPTNIFASDDARATTDSGAGLDSDLLRAYNFDFSVIPVSATILGVEIRYERRYQTAEPLSVEIDLLDDTGSQTGTEKDDQSLSTSDAYASFGGSSDLWGATLSATVVKNSNFGVGFRLNTNGATEAVEIDHVQMRITYEY